ncbi:SH3 domain-containing protein [Anoxybacteroides tepidamans]|uniref:SH3 domain-containing protein n=1 Tax=Anoxybacteroides tepidamans TaxID=265948 RepID=UPI00047F8837|nr:SH3 domain-containing protein [Anoxybacillus tepidamans]
MKAKKWAVSLGLTIGIVTGSVFFTPSIMKASEEVVLASVDWVTAQLNPIKSQIADLQAKVASQQKEIDSLKQQIAKANTLPSTVYAIKNKTAIRSGASTSYKVVAYKNTGDSLKVISTLSSSQGVWYYVQVSSNVKGWVAYSDVSLTRSTASSNQKTVVTTTKTNIRKGASTSYPVVETVERGAMLLFIQSFTNSKGELWYNVQTNSGKRGWMAGYLGEVK